LLRSGQVVAAGRLIDELWGDDAPPGARKLVSEYVLRLRRMIEDPDGRVLVTRSPGYQLLAARSELDACRFEDLLMAGRKALADNDSPQAADLLAGALALWRGPALADVPPGPLVSAEADRLEELRLTALELRIEADRKCGRDTGVVAELRRLTAEHPLRERLWGELMRALHSSGRPAEALEVYAQAREVIADQLGADPGPDLQQLHHHILTGDPARARRLLAEENPAGVRKLTAPTRTRPDVPRQLPAVVRHFVGRTAELERLSLLLDETSGTGGALVVSAIGGTAGAGKTALAVHWAHQVAGRFPDGQLYVNLRGFDANYPVAAADALAGFLRALGVPGEDVPPGEDERAARYRSLLAGRRVLVVLDNAGSAEQARPLVPGTPGCAAVVTSRDSLAGLVARDGAVRLDLDLLPLADAAELLRSLAGDRAAADPGAVTELARQCCRLPLAVRVAAELAATRPSAPLADLVAELADQRRRLDLLDSGGDSRTAVRAVFSWSYLHLPGDAARLFRLLSLHPGTDLDAHGGAALCGETADDAGALLRLLARAHLVQAQGPDRYGMHDLLRAYARELAAVHDAAAEQRAALTRLFDYYLYTAAAAMDILFPAERPRRPQITVPAPRAGRPVTTAGQARAWLGTQRANLILVTAHGVGHGWAGHAARLAATVSRYLEMGGYYAEAATLHTHASAAARAAGDRAAEAAALAGLGFIAARQGNGLQAAGYLYQALGLCHEIGDRIGEARARTNLGLACFQQGLYHEAAEHHREALALHRRSGDVTGQARALNNLGLVAERLGQADEAIEHFGQSLALFRQVGNRVSEAHPLGNLGWAYRLRGRWQQAADHTQQAVALFRETGNLAGEGYALSNAGDVYLSHGRYQQAEEQYRQAGEQYRQALALFRKVGDRPGQARALNGVAEVLRVTGRPTQARTAHQAALDLASRTGDRYEEARAHDGLAHCCQAAGESRQARHHWGQALIRYGQLSVPQASQVRAELEHAGGQ
jgi:DNA-binding SARP family transcriptional activator/Flp pilus assembly protein TadD